MPGSQDPRQQALRTHKKNWSARYKQVSQSLKAAKDILNGKGKVPSKIQDPLPDQLASMLDTLSGEFASLVDDAQKIISEQKTYSSTRRKKQPKRPSQPSAPPPSETAPPPEDKVVQELSQLGASVAGFKLEALGTSRLSRSWEYFKSMF